MSDIVDRLNSALAGRYLIESEIGRGGMATVFLATDPKHNRKVALKVLHPELAATVGHERFLREIEIVAGLTHPRILTLIDSGEANGLLYYVMPFIEGETLAQRLERERQLPVEESLRIARDVAEALHYAHEKGVVHRDVKPSNIMFEAGHAVISDFGVARAVGVAGGGDATATGLAVGTPKYMSPEQAAGGEADGRADVYALGCVLWQMLAGHAPFEGETPQAILAQKMSDTTPSLRVRRSSVAPEIEGVVAKAMASTPADRFQTAAELQRALAAPETAQLRKPPRRRTGAARTAVAIALVAIAVFGGWRLFGGSTEAEAADPYALAVLPFENLTGDRDKDYLAAGMHDAMIIELAKIDALRVISRPSVLRYEGSEKSIPEIASELNVAGIVAASVVGGGDSVRLQLQLIEAAPKERHLWSQAYERALSDVYAMYDDAARAIAGELDLELTEQESADLAGSRQVNPETYRAYLRGMYHLNKSTPEDLARGMEYLEEAVENDPADPLAYAGLAIGYVTLGHGPAPPPDIWSKAAEAAERALRLDSTVAEAHATLAFLRTYKEWDWEGAEEAFIRSNELNPSLAMNHYHYAWYLILMDRFDEAIVQHELARELDPLTPLHTVWIPGLYLYAGYAEEALARARTLREEYPEAAPLLMVEGVAAAHLGRHDEAIAAHERLVEVNPGWMAILGVTYANIGRTEDARRVLEQMDALGESGWTALGRGYLNAALGDLDEAFRWFNYDSPHAWLPWVRIDPFSGPLRDDPRFDELLRKMNLSRLPVS